MRFAAFRALKWPLITGVALLGLGLLSPEPVQIPVEDATPVQWNDDTFWYYPWGSSVTHKGIDIFADRGTPVRTSTHSIVLLTADLSKGGTTVLTLGPGWRLHYYAHLETRSAYPGMLAPVGTPIGTVGTTGNAAGTPPHLHYSIVDLIPRPGRVTNEPHGTWRALYRNPIPYLIEE